jgi:RNA methyltransferase, TrmH family
VSILTKAQIKHIQSFAHKKYRDEQNSFVAEGLKICSDIIKNGGEVIATYCTLPFGLFNECIIEPFEMEKISMLSTPTEVLVIFAKKKISSHYYQKKISLILDGIQDPGNLGTIIRTADWYGIENVICSLDTADAYSSKVVQATMGSIVNVNILRCDLELFLSENKTIPAYATVLQGMPLTEAIIPNEAFLVMGKEGQGIRPDVLLQCKNAIKIIGKGKAESLNVAVATGIICQHFLG